MNDSFDHSVVASETLTVTGTALDDSLPDGREPVRVIWADDSVRLEHATEPRLNQRLDFASLRFELGGNRNAFLFLLHPNLETLQVYVEMTPEVRRYLSRHSILKKSVSGHLAHFRKRALITSLILAAIVAVFAIGFASRAQIAKGVVQLIPFSTEKKVADLVFSRRKAKLEDPNPAQKQLSELTQPLLNADPKWRDRFSIHLESGTEVNAYATLGGHIFVKRGLVQALTTPEQLLGVIAHEMIHAKERHVAQSVFQGAGLFLVVQTLLGDITGIVAVLADQGAPLVLLHTSRELESEADREAVRLLMKAGIDPKGLVEALRVLEKEAKLAVQDTPMEDVGKVLDKVELWSTHPGMERRIQELEAFIASQRAASPNLRIQPIQFDYSGFVKSVQEHY